MPLWVKASKAEDRTSARSAYSKKLKAKQLELIKDEAQLYLKLGNKSEALRLAREAIALNPEGVETLTAALFIFMQCNALDEAEDMLNRIEKDSGHLPVYMENKAILEVLKGRYSNAIKIYETLTYQYPENQLYQAEYARTLYEMGSWRQAYLRMKELNSDQSKLTPVEILSISKNGANSFETDFSHTMGPGGLQSIQGETGVRIWMDEFYQMKVSGTHRYLTRDGREGADSVNDYMPGVKVEMEYTSGKYWSAGGGLISEFYLDRSFLSPIAHLKYDNKKYSTQLEVEWNKLTEDPVEAIDKIGRNTRLLYNQSLILKPGLSIRHEVDLRLLQIDRYSNPVNNDEDLGQRISQLYGVDYALVTVPYISVFYNYVNGRWNQPFDEAEAVIPYLENESRHTVGLYSEIQVTQRFKVITSISHGRDRKRDVHLTIYTGGFEYAVNPENVFKCNYEYDYGDSGTLGSGNTTVITASYARYF